MLCIVLERFVHEIQAWEWLFTKTRKSCQRGTKHSEKEGNSTNFEKKKKKKKRRKKEEKKHTKVNAFSWKLCLFVSLKSDVEKRERKKKGEKRKRRGEKAFHMDKLFNWKKKYVYELNVTHSPRLCHNYPVISQQLFAFVITQWYQLLAFRVTISEWLVHSKTTYSISHLYQAQRLHSGQWQSSHSY